MAVAAATTMSGLEMCMRLEPQVSFFFMLFFFFTNFYLF